MIVITGDVHGAHSIGTRFNSKNFPEQKHMTKDDYVIIVGDFGLVWAMDKEDKYWLKWLDEKPFTTLFIDGNHENFDLLDAYPVEMWNGGKVHKINASVYHLMRGQVFDLQGKRFFTFGGAASHDKAYRKEGASWWKQEMPTPEEYAEGWRNLARVGNKVDIILTHTCSATALDYLNCRFAYGFPVDELHAYLYRVEEQVQYDKWFFGHYHRDEELPDNQVLLYQKKVVLGQGRVPASPDASKS